MARLPYQALREAAYEANMEIPRRNLALYTWGNVSAFDAAKAVLAIKPSGVAYDQLTPAAMVVLDLDGRVIDGRLKPSSDTKTHIVLYRAFTGLGGITHTHSTYAVAWAQARRSVPIYGSTHADHGAAPIPCTAILSEKAVECDYERETGELIVTCFKDGGINPLDMPMVLVAGHGPFTWGPDAAAAVYQAAVLEEVCKMAQLTLSLAPDCPVLADYLVKKHWERKHGQAAYYGQK